MGGIMTPEEIKALVGELSVTANAACKQAAQVLQEQAAEIAKLRGELDRAYEEIVTKQDRIESLEKAFDLLKGVRPTEEIVAERDNYKSALEFYANKSNWKKHQYGGTGICRGAWVSEVEKDLGRRAHQSLNPKEPKGGGE